MLIWVILVDMVNLVDILYLVNLVTLVILVVLVNLVNLVIKNYTNEYTIYSHKTSQELRMLSSVTINCQVRKIVMNPGSQLSVL